MASPHDADLKEASWSQRGRKLLQNAAERSPNCGRKFTANFRWRPRDVPPHGIKSTAAATVRTKHGSSTPSASLKDAGREMGNSERGRHREEKLSIRAIRLYLMSLKLNAAPRTKTPAPVELLCSHVLVLRIHTHHGVKDFSSHDKRLLRSNLQHCAIVTSLV
ncbi:hypothetical protein Q5P01_024102 [Channa striata]|uniref:Uncharacterized protein n=1 Tax=Channa striata TaxID=64152 RepID=A0AA88IPS6_CHASR|nr:hypothetical protein Q5P01_024102 [Channa striata]